MSDPFDPVEDEDALPEAELPEEQEQSLFEAPPMGEQERMVEAILFATAEPVTVRELEARMPHG
ncbi:MAG: SMC-Scp complex subunit ScpB, partial [Paracoccaceae bacterium]|nr:SMC-Scp complex subunit ScpB [Paracoccaceae bacterium]